MINQEQEEKKRQVLAYGFNTRRKAMLGKEFSREQMYNELKSIGFSIPQAKALINKGYIAKRNSGKNASKIYSYVENQQPLNTQQIKNLCVGKVSSKKTVFSEEKAIHDLEIRGYKILKPIGFDEEAFKSEYPDLYKKYLKYE